MKLNSVTKIYNKNKQNEVKALDNVSISFKKGTFYAIMGRSGSGKTTLINILGLMDNPTLGTYMFEDINTEELTQNEKGQIRNQKIGFVFQSFYLEPRLTALENVILPSLISHKIKGDDRVKQATSLLDKLNLKSRLNHYPNELSGGEQQRVAIARALMNNPDVIIADEPTGNLDSKNEKEIFDMLKTLSKEGKCVIVVSHNDLIKEYADEIYILNDGKLRGNDEQ